jgi:hypothetical protein
MIMYENTGVRVWPSYQDSSRLEHSDLREQCANLAVERRHDLGANALFSGGCRS